jgi:hypothetical protein
MKENLHIEFAEGIYYSAFEKLDILTNYLLRG